jgi:alkyl hydroperoxide reductase subunit AhpF
VPIPAEELAVLAQHFERIERPVKIDYFHQSSSAIIVPGRASCLTCDEVKRVLTQIEDLSDQITLRIYEFADEPAMSKKRGIEGVPGTVIRGEVNRPLRFYGLPGGVFLNTLAQAILSTSAGTPTPPESVARTLKKLRGKIHVRVFGSLQHPPSAEAANVAYSVALASPTIDASVYEINEFSAAAQQWGMDAVPITVVGETQGFVGVTTAPELVQFLYDVQTKKEGASISGPPVADESIAPWHPPTRPDATPSGGAMTGEPPSPARPPGTERRTPGGIILPGR